MTVSCVCVSLNCRMIGVPLVPLRLELSTRQRPSWIAPSDTSQSERSPVSAPGVRPTAYPKQPADRSRTTSRPASFRSSAVAESSGLCRSARTHTSRYGCRTPSSISRSPSQRSRPTSGGLSGDQSTVRSQVNSAESEGLWRRRPANAASSDCGVPIAGRRRSTNHCPPCSQVTRVVVSDRPSAHSKERRTQTPHKSSTVGAEPCSNSAYFLSIDRKVSTVWIGLMSDMFRTRFGLPASQIETPCRSSGYSVAALLPSWCVSWGFVFDCSIRTIAASIIGRATASSVPLRLVPSRPDR